MDFLYTILKPISFVISYIMYGFHNALQWIGLKPSSGMTEAQANAINGWNWALSIVGLVIVIRILLIPLFVRQIRASRALQLIQPQMQKIAAKYKGKTDPVSRQAQQEETMALYKESGTNPMSSCLPILLQSPIFFALFYVLRGLDQIATGKIDPIGPISVEVAEQAHTSTIFGAQLSSTFMGSSNMTTKIVTVVLILLMSATQFYTQRQLTMKNMPATALDNPMAKQQKMLMYLMPVIFAVSGVNFPIGVLVYWLTTNLWSMGQQFFVIHRMPAPGSEAEKRMLERKRARAERRGEIVEGTVVETKSTGQRQQPVRKSRQKGSANPLAGSRGHGEAGTGSPKAIESDAGQSGTAKSDAPAVSTSGSTGGGASTKSAGNQRQQPKKKKKKKR